jgi:hypothetical protein
MIQHNEKPVNLGLLGSDSGILELMDLDQRMSLAKFNLLNNINCVLYLEEYKTVIIGFGNGLMKSYNLIVNKSYDWTIRSKNDLIKYFSLESKLLIKNKKFTENVEHNQHKLKGIQILKIFSASITHMITNKTKDCLVFRSSNNEMFIMKLKSHKYDSVEIVPLFLLQMETEIKDFKFHHEGKKLMFTLSSGKVISVEIPDESEIDNQRNYLLDLKDKRLKTRVANLTMMEFQKPQLDENDLFYVLNGSTGEENIEWDPEPISTVLEVIHKEALSNMARVLQERIEECKHIEEQQAMRSNQEEKTTSEENNKEEKNEDKPPLESIKIGDCVDYKSILEKDLVLVSSEGNFLGYLYVLEINELKGNLFVKVKLTVR